ncbi:UNVERIFIED_CONTAM: hypothetical protein FKN15_060033 [Acipenser sinensis]
MRRNSPCWFYPLNPRERQCQCDAPFRVPSEDRPTSHSYDSALLPAAPVHLQAWQEHNNMALKVLGPFVPAFSKSNFGRKLLIEQERELKLELERQGDPIYGCHVQ